MVKQLIIGFATEGDTDVRFLESVIQRSFENIAFECDGPVEVLPVHHIEKENGEFTDVVNRYAQEAYSKGLMVLCIHCDADNDTDEKVRKYKINPSFSEIYSKNTTEICKNLVAIIPVMMTEAWMLCDTNLLKSEIGTNKSDAELGFNKFPEKLRNPKQCIENAIQIARKDVPKRRRHDMTIAELYQPIGQKISITSLSRLPSYNKFKEGIRESLRKLNYLI